MSNSPWVLMAAFLALLIVSCSRKPVAAEFVPPDKLPDVPFRQTTLDETNTGREYYGDVKAVGDINGDGYPDVIFGGHELVWYAYPNWTKSIVSISDMQFTTDMQVADIDSDGDLDIVVPDEKKGKICWFENPRPSGDVNKLWKCHLIGYQGEVTHDVEIGDFNGDGRPDVLTRKCETIVWLQNNPDSFTRVEIKTAMPDGEGTALADINADGRLDIVQNGYWLEGPADPVHGEWTKHVIVDDWPTQLSVAVADINGDERLDVVFAPAESAGKMSWFQPPRNRKTTEWTENVIDPDVDYVHSLQVGDFNNDGVPDLATAEMHQSSHHRVALYMYAGSKQWRRQILSTKGSHNLRAADIGSDGDLDIIGANWGGDYHPLELWENQLIGFDVTSKDWSYVQVDSRRAKWGDFDKPEFARYLGLAAGDVNGDGFDDLVSGRYLYRNPGKDITAAWTRSDFGVNVDAMWILDVDGDGQLDVIAESLPAVYWLKPVNRDATAWKATLIGTVPATEHVNSQGYALAQIIQGGRPEIVLGGGNAVYYFEIPDKPDASGWRRRQIASETSDEGIAVGDIDGDGEIDIATGGKDGRSLSWWKNPGNKDGEWTKFPFGETTEWPDRCVAGDINQDGRLDIVVSEETRYRGATVYWFEQPADARKPNWVRHKIVTQFSTNSLDLADMDEDGAIDVITGEHRGTRKLSIWRNINSGTSWQENVITTGKENHLGAKVVDLNHNGRPEIAGIAWDTYAYLHLWTPRPPQNRHISRTVQRQTFAFAPGHKQ